MLSQSWIVFHIFNYVNWRWPKNFCQIWCDMVLFEFMYHNNSDITYLLTTKYQQLKFHMAISVPK